MKKHLFWLLACIVAAIAFPATAQSPTFAERLGWKQGDRVLILHIDDAGMSHDSNLGVYKAMDQGVANSLSVMMPCPWVPEIVDYIAANPGIDAGLHLTMTAEWDLFRWGPLAGKPAVPGLVDKEGCLWDNVPLVVQNATPDEIETEIRAQLDRARTMGFEPTHMDSHMGTLFATPEFLMRYIKVGIDQKIPVMFPGGHATLIREDTPGRNPAELQAIGKQLWDAGLPVLDDLHNRSYGWKKTNKTDEYIDALKLLKPGVTMMIMHCTAPTEIFGKISDSGDTREGDLNAMVDPRFKKALEDEKIILTTFREMMERRVALDKKK